MPNFSSVAWTRLCGKKWDTIRRDFSRQLTTRGWLCSLTTRYSSTMPTGYTGSSPSISPGRRTTNCRQLPISAWSSAYTPALRYIQADWEYSQVTISRRPAIQTYISPESDCCTGTGTSGRNSARAVSSRPSMKLRIFHIFPWNLSRTPTATI